MICRTTMRLVVLALIVGFPMLHPLHAADPPLKLTISADKFTVKVYEPVTIKVTIENISNQTVDISDPVTYADRAFGLNADYDPRIINGDTETAGIWVCQHGWFASDPKLCSIEPGRTVTVTKIFRPICAARTVTIKYYFVSHSGFPSLRNDEKAQNPQSGGARTKPDNPFNGTVWSNKLTIEIINEIFPEIAKKYECFKSALLHAQADEGNASEEIKKWRKLKCAYFDNEIWDMSFTSNLEPETREGLWRYLLRNLESGRAWNCFDYLLEHAEELLEHENLQDIVIKLLENLASNEFIEVEGRNHNSHNLQWQVNEHLRKKAADMLDRLGVVWREDDDTKNSSRKQQTDENGDDSQAAGFTPAENKTADSNPEVSREHPPEPGSTQEQSSWAKYLRLLLVPLCVLLLLIVVWRKHGV